jgi:hypothetical protein
VKAVAAVIAILISSAILSTTLAQEQTCRLVIINGSSFLEKCGEQLHSFALSLQDIRRQVEPGAHGSFAFNCPIDAMCAGQPSIGGFFIAPSLWSNGSKDAQAIYDIIGTSPHLLKGRTLPVACVEFDITLDGMPGRAACYRIGETENHLVAAIAADDHTGVVLMFFQENQAADVLRKMALELLPKFKIERAGGDAALLRWLR